MTQGVGSQDGQNGYDPPEMVPVVFSPRSNSHAGHGESSVHEPHRKKFKEDIAHSVTHCVGEVPRGFSKNNDSHNDCRHHIRPRPLNANGGSCGSRADGGAAPPQSPHCAVNPIPTDANKEGLEDKAGSARLKEDKSWITQVRPHGDAQRFTLYDPCLSFSLNADDSDDEPSDGAADASTDQAIHVRKLARSIEAAEREQGKLKEFWRRTREKQNGHRHDARTRDDETVADPPQTPRIDFDDPDLDVETDVVGTVSFANTRELPKVPHHRFDNR